MLVVALLAVGGWAFGTGRLGFGPLSSADKAAASAIADGVNGPKWADDDQRACAATKLLKHHRSGGLADTGLIKRDGSKWTYTGDWDVEDAQTFSDALLECSDDWKKQVADEWDLSDTGCLDDVGRQTVADVFVTTDLGVHSGDATKVHDDAASALDDCYKSDLTAPKGTASPAYRAVKFTFDSASADNAKTSLNVNGPDGTQTVTGSTYTADAGEGGKRVCVDVTVEATYGWGTTATSDATHICGKSKPKRLWWAKAPRCTDEPGCVLWVLHAEGYRTGIEDLTISGSGGGDCPLVSNDCKKSAFIGSDGRGLDGGAVLKVTGGPGRRNDLVAKMGGLTAKMPG